MSDYVLFLLTGFARSIACLTNIFIVQKSVTVVSIAIFYSNVFVTLLASKRYSDSALGNITVLNFIFECISNSYVWTCNYSTLREGNLIER